jgi:hypothetical protein
MQKRLTIVACTPSVLRSRISFRFFHQLRDIAAFPRTSPSLAAMSGICGWLLERTRLADFIVAGNVWFGSEAVIPSRPAQWLLFGAQSGPQAGMIKMVL